VSGRESDKFVAGRRRRAAVPEAGGERGSDGWPWARRSSCRTHAGAVGSGEQAVDAVGEEAGRLVASGD